MRLLASIACLLALGVAHADDSKAEDYDRHVLLDPAAGTERQLEQARIVEREARRGNADAQYLLGALYRLGKRHPAALFERDDDKAVVLLSNAAVQGQLQAMAGMAELELRRERPMDAMVWAQAFTLYEKERPRHTLEKVDPQAYAAYLLQRCYAKVGRGDDVKQQLEAAFLAFQQNHDAKIRAGLARGSPRVEPGSETLEMLSPGPRYIGATPSRKEERMKTPGMALFLIGIDAEGSVQKRLVIDSLPDDTFADGLTRMADHTRFNPAPEGTELRWAVLPVGYDNHTYAIRPKSE